jgi:hypothetical protein
MKEKQNQLNNDERGENKSTKEEVRQKGNKKGT